MESNPEFKQNPGLKLMEQVQQVMRYHHYAYRTERAYSDWILRCGKFHGAKTHPRCMGIEKVETFSSHLVACNKVSVSTRRQAMGPQVFL